MVLVKSLLKEVIKSCLKKIQINKRMIVLIFIVINIFVFWMVRILLKRIWKRLVEFLVILIKMILRVKKEEKVMLMVVLFLIIEFFLMQVMMIAVSSLKIMVLIKKLRFKIKERVIFGKIVCEMVFFMSDILCRMMKYFIVLVMILMIMVVIKVFCRKWNFCNLLINFVIIGYFY